MKNNFLSQLEYLLKEVPQEVRKDIMYDYEEHFRIGLQNGRSYEELEKELGEPEDIARELLADQSAVREEKVENSSHPVKAFFAALGLFFFNLIFVFGPVMGLIGIYIGLCIAAFTLTLSPLFFLLYPYIGLDGFLTKIFASLFCFGLGVLLGIGMIKTGKFLFQSISNYLKFNINVVKRQGGMAG